MSNGTTRYALAKLQLGNKKPENEMKEELIRLDKAMGDKMPLKAGASSHNHSSSKNHARK